MIHLKKYFVLLDVSPIDLIISHRYLLRCKQTSVFICNEITNDHLLIRSSASNTPGQYSQFASPKCENITLLLNCSRLK